jgi:tRNA (guanine-N7-)-methyltransferase
MILDLKKNGNEIDKIFINFPDPWFKEKHKKRRFLNEKILEDLYEVLGENSEIIFQTDQKSLFKDTLKVIKENRGFSVKKFKFPLLGIQSYWEKMKIEEGNKIFRMALRKKDKKTKKWWNIF